jgi:23S rRNA (cytosine1962-C5)-methyltransferase
VTNTARLVLRSGKERSLRRRHPWVFSGAVDRVVGSAGPGDTVAVCGSDGSFLAWAAYSPASQIVARVWSFSEDTTIDASFIAERVTAAATARRGLEARTSAARLVFAESDLLPGVIIDRYADVAVLELTTVGADRWRDAIADACASLPGVSSVYERSDVDIREREGLAARHGLLRGPEPAERIEIVEDGAVFALDVRRGHKTGFYLDQRESRAAIRRLSNGRRVLNVFAYTGGFSVAAWQGGATKVTTVDSSGPSLELARENLRRNSFPENGIVEADAFTELRRLRDADARFDLVILDPPKLVHRQHQLDKGARAYKDLNWLGIRLLNPGGLLVTFSCSGAVSAELHQKIVADAALDAGRDLQIVGRLDQAEDHPVLASFPESQYLKGLIAHTVS